MPLRSAKAGPLLGAAVIPRPEDPADLADVLQLRPRGREAEDAEGDSRRTYWTRARKVPWVET